MAGDLADANARTIGRNGPESARGRVLMLSTNDAWDPKKTKDDDQT
jgi:hypothetical protein